MTAVMRIGVSSLQNVMRSRWAIVYGLFFLVLTQGLFHMMGQNTKVILSLVNITLFLVPLMSAVFATMYFYNSREFVELLLTQPLRRVSVFVGLFSGLTLSLATGFVAGVGLPFAIHGIGSVQELASILTLLVCGVALTWIFVALGFVVSVAIPDKGKGLGVTLLVWLVLALVYDGLILAAVHAFSEYPLEKPVLAAVMANPIDLARVLLLTQIDAAALMGYTGAVFRRFFGGPMGMIISAASLVVWSIAPLMIGLWCFRRRDF
ncbi:MAG: ABC transporter permease [Candidatus Zixiibacteriota bacterium]